MAIFASVFAALGQQANRFLTAALGWASTLLFGRVPKSKQILIVLITLGSIVWVVLLVGIAFPRIGTFLLAALPIPSFVNQNWVRLAMLIGALVVPILIGIAGLLVVDASQRPKGLALVKGVLRGYPVGYENSIRPPFGTRGRAHRGDHAVRWSARHRPLRSG